MKQTSDWDAIVVGGGAAGLATALMLGRARRRTLVIDAGQPRNRYAAHMHGVLGHEGLDPAELLRRGRKEVVEYGVEVRDGSVERVEELTGGLRVALATGEEASTRALVVATGLTDRLPDIPGLAERWGASVLHCPYCHGWEVRGQRLGVLATSPLNLHQAQLVRQWSADVTLFTAAIEPLETDVGARLRSRGVRLVREAVVEVLGEGTAISGVRLTDGSVVELDAIFTGGALLPHDGFLEELGLERAENPMGSYLAVDGVGQTSHPRIWAAGNVVNPGANVPLAIGAGTMTGSVVNMALVTEEFDAAAS
ncbi:NAD(P)/FAD-dependent oxidoreductase [Nocardioides massiliensis]|uniref:Thioredoxin reductase n=1 Tax=Nocardioides massiliensis TaxID=1325935 RepID=A0ABT9NPP6_9ACTN|nr:NAD(P)/FAD-dependent oxidoreductase [Nocardioides massiliensis]MDP9822385.1 thioredoxin reductase [Nocardioides massiliensis]